MGGTNTIKKWASQIPYLVTFPQSNIFSMLKKSILNLIKSYQLPIKKRIINPLRGLIFRYKSGQNVYD
jgi:hypothetical protein